MARTMLAGATSQSIYMVILDSTSTTGGRKTGLAFNTASLTAYYVLNGGSAVAITLATLAAANSAYSSGGFKEVDATNMPGVYRLDVPNAAIASGPGAVITLKGATGMVQVDIEIQLEAINAQDSVRAGLTALPNAAAEAAGGLFTRGTGAGQINQAANGLIDTSVLRWNGTAVTTPVTAGTPVVDWIPSGWRKNTAQTGAASTITLDASASATDSLYKYSLIMILSGTGAGQARLITGYVGATKVATVTPSWTTNPSSDSVFALMPLSLADVAAWQTAAVSTPTNAGVPNVNTKTWNDLATVELPMVPATAGRKPVVDSNGLVDSNVVKLGPTGSGTAQTARDVGASVLVGDKTGFSLSGAGVQAIWDALTSALTTAGSVGKKIVDNLDATVSSRSTTATILAATYEGAETIQQHFRLVRAALYGKLSGAATTTVVIKAKDDSTTRITATVDSDGNRTAVTLDPDG